MFPCLRYCDGVIEMKEHANAVGEGGCSVMRLAETAAAARGGPDPKVAEL